MEEEKGFTIIELVIGIVLLVVVGWMFSMIHAHPERCEAWSFKVGDQVTVKTSDDRVADGVVLSRLFPDDARCFYRVKYQLPELRCGFNSCNQTGKTTQGSIDASQGDITPRQEIK